MGLKIMKKVGFMIEKDYKIENEYRKEKLLTLIRLLDEFEKDKQTIIGNLEYVMDKIILVAKSENYKATLTINIEEVLDK